MTTIHTLMVLAATLTAQPRGEVLDFSATWCGPCQRMSPVVSRLEREGLPIRKVDVDQQRSLAQQFNVQNIPTFILVVDGQEVTRVVGPTTESELRRMIARIPQPAPEKPDVVPLNEAAPVARSAHPPVPREQAESALAEVEPERRTPAPGNGIFGFLHRGDDRNEAEHAIVRGLEDEVPSQQSTRTSDGPMAGSARIRVTDNGRINLGSGTVIGSRPGMTLVLTCGHIFRDLDESTKIDVEVFEGGKPLTYVGSVVKYDIDADVGLITIPIDHAVAAAPICPPTHVPATGDRVACIGCSGGDDPSREQLEVTAINKYTGPDNIECTGVPVRGRSGGGLFNTSGELVGVCIAADPDHQRGLYAHVNAVHDLLDECGLTALYQPEEPENAPSEPRQIAADASGNVIPASQPSAPMPTQTASAGNLLEQAGITNIPAGDAEVVVIIRPKNQPAAPSRVVIINQASSKFFAYLNGELDSPAATPTPDRILQTTQTIPAPSEQPEWYESRRVAPPVSPQTPQTAEKESLQPTTLSQPVVPHRYVRSGATR